MAEVDPIAAVVGFLGADSAIGALAEDRIWGGELPPEYIQHWPGAATGAPPPGGGLLGRGYQQYGDHRIDVDCYGTTRPSSYKLYLAVRRALKDLRRAVHDDALLHWARVSSEGRTLVDPNTGWPLTIASWQVLVGEVPVTT
jgi:hypothetical protein